MREVAAEARVAVMTVSYSYTQPQRVAPATRIRVLDAAARLGYTGPDPVARSLRQGATGNLGVVLGEHLGYAFEDAQASRFLAGVSRVCVENRLGLVLIPSTGAPDDVDRVREAAVDGFVLWTTVHDDPVLAAVVATGRPAAIQGGPAAGGLTVVASDDRAAARAAAAQLVEPGLSPLVLSFPLDRSRETGLQWGPSTDAPFPVTRARLQGYRDAVEEAGRRWEETPVVVVSRNDRDASRRAVREASADVRPDAVIAMSDELAAGSLDELGSSVRVVGWDDSDLARTLGFSSVRQSLFDQGVACARIAAGQLATVDTQPWELALR
jgi:DNA-binding LacI/PurR family transcriptional regulator